MSLHTSYISITTHFLYQCHYTLSLPIPHYTSFIRWIIHFVAIQILVQSILCSLSSETIEGLRNKFLKLNVAFESKCLVVNLEMTKVMVSGGITLVGLSKSNVDPYGVCSLRVKANSVLFIQCGMWIHGRCARVKMVTPKFSRNFTCRKCEGNIREAVEQEEKLCDEVETVTGNSHILVTG